MGISLNEILPFLLGDGNISGIQIFRFSDFHISHFGNDGETGKFRNAHFSKRSENLGTHNFWDARNEKIEMCQNPRFHTTYDNLKWVLKWEKE